MYFYCYHNSTPASDLNLVNLNLYYNKQRQLYYKSQSCIIKLEKQKRSLLLREEAIAKQKKLT